MDTSIIALVKFFLKLEHLSANVGIFLWYKTHQCPSSVDLSATHIGCQHKKPQQENPLS